MTTEVRPRAFPIDVDDLSRAFVRLLAAEVGEAGLDEIRSRSAQPGWEEADPVEATTKGEPLIRQALAEVGWPIPDHYDPIEDRTMPGPIDDAAKAFWVAAVETAKRNGFSVEPAGT